MAKRIYVGNLPYEVTDNDLEQVFSAHGKVESARVITDMATGRSKGFGFVEMLSDDEANSAIQACNGMNLKNRTLKVNEARPREASGRGDRR